MHPSPAALVCLLTWLVPVPGAGAPGQPVYRVENDHLRMRLTPRTPQQIEAFYSARGFPAEMVETLTRHCFVTVGIANRRSDVLWLELARWHFAHGGASLSRFDRDHWRERWRAMNAPLSSQSTFRWTLLPETLGFLPGESEGGNIVLPRLAGPITLEARFATGEDRSGETLVVRVTDLRCAEDQAP